MHVPPILVDNDNVDAAVAAFPNGVISDGTLSTSADKVTRPFTLWRLSNGVSRVLKISMIGNFKDVGDILEIVKTFIGTILLDSNQCAVTYVTIWNPAKVSSKGGAPKCHRDR